MEASIEVVEASVVVNVPRSFHDCHGSLSKIQLLPWKLVEACGSFYGRGSLYKFLAKHSSLFTPPIGQDTGLLASYIIDCESCKWSISTNSASTESSARGLMSRYDFVASGVDLPAVCPYPCWCRVGDDDQCDGTSCPRMTSLFRFKAMTRTSLKAHNKYKAAKREKTRFYR